MPRVTVVVPAYNAQEFIGHAIQSVQAQVFEDWELVIVNDGSSDGTARVVRTYCKHDKRIRLIDLPQNAGPAGARNAGFQAANGEWVAILDADDTWRPDRLSMLLNTPEAASSDIIGDRIELFNAATQHIEALSWPWIRKPTKLTIEKLLLWDLPGWRAPIGWVQPVFRRDFLLQNKLRYPTDLRYGEDWCLMVDALQVGAVVTVLPYAGYRYTLRRDEKNFSQTSVDFGALYKTNAQLAIKYRSALSPGARLLFWLRGYMIQSNAETPKLKRAYVNRQWFHLLLMILKNPAHIIKIGIRSYENYRWHRKT